mgnify:FL=1
MQLQLVFVGKTALSPIDAAIDRYLERLVHFVPTRVHHVKAEKILPKAREARIREKESDRILDLVGKEGSLIVWDRRGRALDSVGLAGFLQQLVDRGGPRFGW